ncbi:MAG: adenylate/guanylate cyclase domain-containing protein [Alphaproteobacteria bacterium]|nr:adenylate/guanylate cyclase domain-containing protein [Alphaproteobacteria bacterium]
MDLPVIAAHELGIAARERAAPVNDWLLAERVRVSRITHFTHSYCTKLREIGLPVERATFHIRQLHPQLMAKTVLWNHEAGGAVELGREHGVEDTPFFRRSPVNAVYETAKRRRYRLDDPDAVREFSILDDLIAQGFVDYVINPMRFSGDRPAAHSIATRDPGGFPDLDIATMDAIMPTLGAVVELSEIRRTARTLLETYLGRQAGSRVLRGRIKRGDGDIIEAVIWLCDLRGFTAISEAMDLKDVIAHLNRYFDCLGEPIQRNGGEILKFIGDAILAIFISRPDESDLAPACMRAATAARQALARTKEINTEHAQQGLPPIECGIGLHVGEVMYGNIGAADRLDFTVVGPAVNRAARLESLAADLGRSVLASREFAGMAQMMCNPLGAYVLKGVAEPQDVFDLVGCD